jgi:hypothetical protein
MSHEEEAREKYIILLLGSDSKPVPSELHAQKELFILSMVNPKVDDFFKFEKHYQGPYSHLLSELIREPKFYPNAYAIKNNGLLLTNNGKERFKEINNEHAAQEKFSYLKHSLELIRKLYDQLTQDELLFLMYDTFPEYIEKSNKYEDIMKMRNEILRNLSEKKILTDEKYAELLRRSKTKTK